MSCSGRGRSSPPVLVEFIGTPGSGKTTLARRLIEELGREGAAAGSVVGSARDHAARTRLGAVAALAPAALRRPLLWRAFYLLATFHGVRFSLEHRALVRDVVRAQYERAIPASTRRHILYWFFQLCGRHRFLRTTSCPGEVLVVDDGFLHRSVHLNASHTEAPDLPAVARYLDLIPRPDLVVHASAPREVCVRRVLERGVWPHSRGLTQTELERYIERAETVVREAVNHVRRRGWTIVEVPTAGSREDAAAALAGAVATIRRSVRPGEEVAA